MIERLNKVLARAGIASRRGADRLIAEGRVWVNGSRVRELGTKVDPRRDAVKIDGKSLPRSPRRHTYLMLHKPKGYVTTLSDPEGRPTVRDLLGGISRRVYPVGRLDFQSEGLLLLTDDGDLARDLMHPRSGVPKTYLVKVQGRPAAPVLARLARGIVLDGRRTLPARVRVVRAAENTWLELTITEGRKQQIRRMMQAVGHRVTKLRRVRYGGLTLGELAPGGHRALQPKELDRLRRSLKAGRKPRLT